MIAHICSLFCVNISEVVLKLRSVLGVDAQALLSRYGLLKPFLQQMVIESLTVWMPVNPRRRLGTA